MEVSKEKLEEIANRIKSIRIFQKEDGTKYFNEAGAGAIETLSKDVDIIRENFAYFSKRPTSILYPDEFLHIMQNLPYGRKMLADNLEYILTNFNNKRAQARYELIGIHEVSEKVAENFDHFFKISIFGEDKEVNYTMNPDLRYTACCPETVCSLFNIFLRYVSGAENPSEVLEANKDLFFNYAFNSAMLPMVKTLSKNPKCHQFIRDNFETIKENCYVPHLAELYTNIRDICPEEFAKEAFTIDKIYLPAIEHLEGKNIQGKEHSDTLSQINITCSELIKQGRTHEFEELMNFLMNSSDNHTMKICGSGYFNITVQAGDKAVKLGGNECSRTDDDIIPYHPRILLPIVRRKDASKDSKHPLYIGIYELVDVDVEITDEELLAVYKELREDGIRWLDIKKENLGRLRRDNLQYEIGQNIPTPIELLGFEESGVERRTLHRGELVVIDLDFLYKDGKADEMGFISEKVPDCIREYEAEYMRRKRGEEVKKLVKKQENPSPFDEH